MPVRLLGNRRSGDRGGSEAALIARSAAFADLLVLSIVAAYVLIGGDRAMIRDTVAGIAMFAATGFALRRPRLLGRTPATKLVVRVLAMTTFVTFVVWHTGGVASPLVSLYLLPIVLAALALRLALVLALLIVITGLYVAAARYVSGVDIGSAPFLARLCGAIGPFVIVAWLTAELGRQLLATRRRDDARREADPLTGLATVAAFMDAVAAERQRAARDGRGYALILVELAVDPKGAAPAESGAKLVASVLGRALRDTDLAARTAPTTFAALLPGADFGGAQTVANRVRHAVHAATVRVGTRMVRVQVECAAAAAPADGDQARDLLAAAARRLSGTVEPRGGPLPG